MPQRIPFDPKKPLYVRHAFSTNGHKFQNGQLLNWKQLAISARRLSQLWDGRFIDHDETILKLGVTAEPEPVEPASIPPEPEAPAEPQYQKTEIQRRKAKLEK